MNTWVAYEALAATAHTHSSSAGGGGGGAAAGGLEADAAANAAAALGVANFTLHAYTHTGLAYGDTGWSEEFRGLLGFKAVAVALLFSLLPFAVQASALIAENVSVPLLVMDTMKSVAHRPFPF